jgi:NAD(P)-dependent dehydrogenase (short-subunit alcohol dehydrogenase family)
VSKAALDHLSRVWAEELSTFGVRVLAFDPGEMDTAMHRAALPDADRATLAAPEHVARRLLDALADARIASGARLTADGLGGEP